MQTPFACALNLQKGAPVMPQLSLPGNHLAIGSIKFGRKTEFHTAVENWNNRNLETMVRSWSQGIQNRQVSKDTFKKHLEEKDDSGKTAYQIAVEQENNRMASLLEGAMIFTGASFE